MLREQSAAASFLQRTLVAVLQQHGPCIRSRWGLRHSAASFSKRLPACIWQGIAYTLCAHTFGDWLPDPGPCRCCLLAACRQLDILAGVKVAGKARGQVLLNGSPRKGAAFASLASYVQQKDVLVPSATVSSSSSSSGGLAWWCGPTDDGPLSQTGTVGRPAPQ
jgi:hypothetical protein